MVPTSLPELPKPSRTLGKSQKLEFYDPKCQRKIRGKIFIFLINPFLGGPPPGEMDQGRSALLRMQHSQLLLSRSLLPVLVALCATSTLLPGHRLECAPGGGGTDPQQGPKKGYIRLIRRLFICFLIFFWDTFFLKNLVWTYVLRPGT